MDILQLILSIAAAAAYLAQLGRLSGAAFARAGAAAHALALGAQFAALPSLQPALMISAFMLITLPALWQSLQFAALRRWLLCLAAAAAVCPLLLPPAADAAAFSLHGALALAVYALAAVAFFLCLDARFAEQQLRRAPQQTAAVSLLARENTYFRCVLAAFILLTLTLASGLASAAAADAPLFAWTHKQLFAYLTWGVFGALLAGRRFAGWRGGIAQRWFFSGYAFLLLSYLGSALVRQFIRAG